MTKMDFKQVYGLVIGLALLGGAGFLGGCQKLTSENTIKIGEYGSMTGSEATFGQSTHKGIQLAIEEINQTGGIQGKKIELISVDNQGKPEEAAAAVTKLITVNKVVAILGEVASSRSLAGGPIAQRYGVPMISPSSTNPKVTQIGNFIFRTCFIDPFQGKVMADFAFNSLGMNTVAILRDIKNDYSVGLADYFTQTFRDLGGTVISDLSYASGDVDFKAQLTAIRSLQPQALFVPGYYTEVGLIARQARELGLDAVMLGGDGWDSHRLVEIGGQALENTYFSNHYAADSTEPNVVAFVNKFKSRYGSVPDGMAATGYDAALVLIDALKRTQNQKPEEIRQALVSMQRFQAATGFIEFDANRDAQKPAVVLKIEQGKFKYVKTIQL
jgi:branched-chain amino acid transport system substrate-binding protein